VTAHPYIGQTVTTPESIGVNAQRFQWVWTHRLEHEAAGASPAAFGALRSMIAHARLPGRWRI
jgi:hypothetical protein